MIVSNLFEGETASHAHIFHEQEAADIFRKDGASIRVTKQGVDGETGVQA